MSTQYQWQGEPVKVRFGYVDQQENKEKPLFWFNFECYNKEEINGDFVPDHFVADNGNHFAFIPAIEVTYGPEKSFLMSNHFGIGVHKLINGGWPSYAHFSLEGQFKESDMPYFAIKKFDLEGYEAHEAKRNNWQKANFPQEYARLETLRDTIRNLRKVK